MRATSWLPALLALLLSSHVASQPLDMQRSQSLAARAPARCKSLKQRVNWNTLTKSQKKSYIDAVKCLKTKPKQTQFAAAKNLYDDFAAIHINQDHNIHSVAAFLPWHRRFVQAREKALQSCGYTGPTPYWDWTQSADKNDPINDPILSPKDGFGGIGRPSTGDSQNVVAGPFANFTLNLIQGDNGTPIYSPHKIRRSLENNPSLIHNFNSTAVAKASTFSKFNDYRYYVEGTPHGAVHMFVGGDMAPASSPQEPLFFLHHAQIDRMWTNWQEKDRTKRLTDYAGNLPGASSLDGPFEAKIDDMLPSFGGLISQVKVRDVMDTKAGDLCYEYV
ncbi:related to monophenol monooxygenase [Ustilago trichophora]|uniref:Related to monophenol monooxygenase n=1 Tax=Ustilago trichophora TaxID=86804 RepID=A0A5C3EPK4_9BASI|nr:related to monophenol monooxygenase [Ustilago trichophora]